MNVSSELTKLREKMTEVGIDVCLIPTSDCHNSEYIAPYYKVREHFSNFTGSAGTLVVLDKEAYLFTDGRYFIQAAKELEGTGITLMKMGEKGVPTLKSFVSDMLDKNMKVGFDGKTMSASFINGLSDANPSCLGLLDPSFEPAENIWTDRPALEHNKVFIMGEKLAGESVKSKLAKIRGVMIKEECDVHITAALDDIAWTVNLRGSDIADCPVFLSYMIISQKEAVLYADPEGQHEIIDYLSENGIILKKYADFYDDLKQRENKGTKERVLLDSSKVNYMLYNLASQRYEIVDCDNPATMLKCIKNDIEIENIKKANIYDGVAMVRFNKYLDEILITGDIISEMSVADKLYEFRLMNEEIIEPSFETISAFGSNGAIIHYSATPDTNARIEPKDTFLMMDSGAHYRCGTTDVTRTYSIGNPSEKLKHDYTLVLKAMLRLMNHEFLYGCRGNNLDVIARDVFWKEGLDFKHGTGHGIGYVLNVHEDPVRISFRIPKDSKPSVIFEPGMLSSDEPGIYREGEYGIRIENDILCVVKRENENGLFLGFEPMTMVPIDTKAIIIDEMNDDELNMLNNYHQTVFERLSPYLEGEELDYLKKVTAPLKRKA